jgi:nitric oxide reductase large subunit
MKDFRQKHSNFATKKQYYRFVLCILLLLLRRFLLGECIRHVGVCGDYDVAQVTGLVLPFDVGNVSHHHVHEGVLDQAQKHEHRARRHKNVDGL